MSPTSGNFRRERGLPKGYRELSVSLYRLINTLILLEATPGIEPGYTVLQLPGGRFNSAIGRFPHASQPLSWEATPLKAYPFLRALSGSSGPGLR